MTAADIQGLNDAIRADPLDPVPRLILADMLASVGGVEVRGDGWRAVAHVFGVWRRCAADCRR